MFAQAFETDLFPLLNEKYEVKIDHPTDWYELVKNARENEEDKFEVVEMKQKDVFDFNALFKTMFTMRSLNENKKKFLWKDVKWVRYDKENVGQVLYKKSFSVEEEFLVLNIRKRGKVKYSLENLKPCCLCPLPISKEKKNDLMSVLNLIRPDVREFYENFPTDETLNTVDFDLIDLEENESLSDTENNLPDLQENENEEKDVSDHQNQLNISEVHDDLDVLTIIPIVEASTSKLPMRSSRRIKKNFNPDFVY
ncbi:hypothetical protein TKK_0003485 [Trichogramma kaykai]